MSLAEFKQKLTTDDIFLDAFKAHLTRCFCVENVLFWIDYSAFQAKIHAIAPGQKELRDVTIRRECKFLYNKYIDPNSQYELNLPASKVDSLRTAIKENRFNLNMYDGVAEATLLMMYENNLANFLSRRRDVLDVAIAS